MKKVGTVFLVAVFLSVTYLAQAVDWPALAGNWKGSLAVANSVDGYESFTIKVTVTSQKGPLFMGYLVNLSNSETNWIVGALQQSLIVAKGYDVSISLSSPHDTKVFGTGLLRTDTTPWKITRMSFTGFHDTPGPAGNLVARGSLTKK